MLLIGDVGGTNARLALAAPGTTEPLATRRLATADFADFDSALAAFLDGLPAGTRIAAGCLAVAGPIADDGRSARLTNLPWTIDADALAARFGLGRLALANDFAAAALGVTVSPADTLLPLQAGEPLAAAPKLVVGAGTGLGMATLLPVAGGFRVAAGEGGHAAFAPADELQVELWRDLHARHGRVTAERVVSGPGLAAIHDFLCRREGRPNGLADPAAIAAAAVAAPESTARRAVELFLSAYGAFAGDMALAVMARGGVYLAGGILAKLVPPLSPAPLLAAFDAKAEHAALARRMPIAIAADPALGLRGAAVLAMELT